MCHPDRNATDQQCTANCLALGLSLRPSAAPRGVGHGGIQDVQHLGDKAPALFTASFLPHPSGAQLRPATQFASVLEGDNPIQRVEDRGDVPLADGANDGKAPDRGLGKSGRHLWEHANEACDPNAQGPHPCVTRAVREPPDRKSATSGHMSTAFSRASRARPR